jgi:MFS transporter, DHA1 family, multidrug resistance protein
MEQPAAADGFQPAARPAGALPGPAPEPAPEAAPEPGPEPGPGSGAGPGRAEQVRLIFILGALTAIGPLSVDMYLPALPSLTRDLSAAPSLVQLTLTACLAGLAAGQLVAGPVSDAWGRRRPVLAGVAIYAAASLLCMVAPNVTVLIAFRLVQGAAGGAAIVIARAVVRDLYDGTAAARFFALLMLVNGLGPVLAPVVGGQLLRFTSWRGVFVVLASLGALMVVAALAGLRETLPAADRHAGGLAATVRTFRRLCGDRGFAGYTLSGGLAFAAMFAYISGSPFVIQEIYHLSPQQFSLIFAVNALGIIACSQLSAVLVRRVPPRSLLGGGLAMSLAGAALLVTAVTAHIGLPAVLPALWLVAASIGLIMPNATALALSGRPPRLAGSASALVGVAQFLFGGTAAPLVGVAGPHTAVPLAVVIAILSVSALLAFVILAPRRV